MPVRIFRTWLAIAMALAYLPASGYCLLEKTGLVPTVDCCSETASHNQEEQAPCDYGCCPIEYAVYSGFDSGVADLVSPPADVTFLAAFLLPELPAEVSVVRLERSPPDIPKSWQFAFRTALPPRAPSSLS